jgi:hypothetical protein
MNSIPSVQTANKKHNESKPKATIDDTVSPSPFVTVDQTRDSDGEDDQCRDTRREKTSFGGFKASLLEEKRGVLNVKLAWDEIVGRESLRVSTYI